VDGLRVLYSASGKTYHQRFIGLSHPLVSDHPVKPFANNIHNVVSSLKERVYFIDSVGNKRPGWEADAKVEYDLARRLGNLVSPAQVSWAHFVSTRPGSKRKLYEESLRKLVEEPYSLRQLAETQLFTKFERTWWTKPQVPRIINPRDPRYHILLGSYIHGVEKPIFDGLSQLIGQAVPCVAKGYTQEEKALHIRELLSPGWKCIGLDASRFDQCVGETALDVEHTVYREIYKGDETLSTLLKYQLDNVGRYRSSDGKLIAKMGAIRCSGDVNTSLGNCIISVLLAHSYCLSKGIAHRIYCDGDDLLLFVKTGVSLEDLPSWYLQRGMRMKVETPAFTLEEVEFCQSKVVWCSDRWALVRNPTKCLTTDFTGFLDCANERVWEQVVHSTGSCGLSLFAGCPVLQEWYLWGLRHGRNHGMKLNRGQGIADYYMRCQKIVKRKQVDVTDEARASFSQAFGITPSQQLELEQIIRNMQRGAGFMRNKNYCSTTLNTLL